MDIENIMEILWDFSLFTIVGCLFAILFTKTCLLGDIEKLEKLENLEKNMHSTPL
jgi:hypothetical protein